MKETQDQFILMDRVEFEKWIQQEQITRRIKLIQNHHTAIPSYSNFNGRNHFERLIAMRNYHMQTNGWSDIGQNLTTFPDGTIAVCRSLNVNPAGIKGANTGGICIEHFGNFNLGKDKIHDEHRKSIVFLNAVLCERFTLDVSLDSIVYHHWYDLQTGKRTNGSGLTKTCPGTNFFGGNTPEDAGHNFYPKIEAYMKSRNWKTDHKLKKGVVNTNILRIRSGAGITFEVLGSLQKNEQVKIYEERNGWYRIAKDQQWVSGKYIEIEEGVLM